MYVMDLKIDSSHIDQAAAIFIPGHSFDQERKDFIELLDTCDLLAVPGSGKTTALMAKLYCLAKKGPLPEGRGILVLAHTNFAVEEIENKLKPHCPELFVYPNFVGTLQSFLNRFLAKQANSVKYGSRIHKNDNDIYLAEVSRFFNALPWKSSDPAVKPLRTKLLSVVIRGRDDLTDWDARIATTIDFLSKLKFDMVNRKFLHGDTGKVMYAKPNETYLELEKWKEGLLRSGLLSYSDSYFLSKWYLGEFPALRQQLQLRFQYVFVDEMQDLDTEQINIVDDIFFNGLSSIQRIGDINQAIYSSGKQLKVECDWKTRETLDSEKYKDRYLNGSNRLTPEIANLVNGFTLNDKRGKFKVIGKNISDTSIPPHLILFTNDSKEKLEPCFRKIVQELQEKKQIPGLPKNPFKIIGWSAEWKSDEQATGRIRLHDIFPGFHKKQNTKREDFNSLSDYLQLYDTQKKTLEAVRKSILNALIHILRLENKKHIDPFQPEGFQKYYSKTAMLKAIREYHSDADHEKAYRFFTLKLYNWCYDLKAGNATGAVFEDIKKFVSAEFASWFSLTLTPATIAFIKSFREIERKSPSKKNSDSIPIEIATIHSVKGQTHCATMYIETSYYDYEINKIKDRKPFFKEKHACTKAREKETLKMLYVGFSRPTHLLCYAMQKNNLHDGDLQKFIASGWVILEV